MPEIELGETLEALIDHRGKTVKKLGGEFSDVGVPVVSAVNIKNGRIDFEQRPRFVSQRLFSKWMPIPLRTKDVILTSEAPLGEVALVPSDDPLVLGQRLFALRGKEGILDSRYLFYLFQWAPVRDQLVARSTGTTVVGIRQAELVKIRIPLVPFEAQQAAAAILGALDEKIEANRQVVATLLSLISATWREAFGMRSDREWPIVTIGEVATVVGGSTPRTNVAEFWTGPIAWATPRDLSRLPSAPLFDTERHISEEGLRQISSSLLPAGTVLLSSRAPIGYLAIAEVPLAVNQGFIALVPRDRLSNLYLWQWLQANLDAVILRANGTTFLEISKGSFRPMPIEVPPSDVMRAWTDSAAAQYRLIVAKESESRSVSQLRDALLPQLLSGDLHIRAAEKLVESSV